MNMDYNKVFLRSQILSQIPMIYNGKEMPSGLAVPLLLLQTAYRRKVNEFEEFMQDVLKKMKKEGFDDRVQKFQNMEDIYKRQKKYDEWKDGDGERPVRPTNEEIAKADKIKEGKDEFDKELSALEQDYSDARTSKSKEEVKIAQEFTEDNFRSLVEYIGIKGTIKFKAFGRDEEMPNDTFLSIVAENLID